MLKELYAFIAGLGYVPPPNPGNTANAPAPAPVQRGTLQFIQPDFTGGSGDNQAIVNIDPIPPAYQDTQAFGFNVMGISGQTGGGSTGIVPDIDNGAILYYDPETGQYIDLTG